MVGELVGGHFQLIYQIVFAIIHLNHCFMVMRDGAIRRRPNASLISRFEEKCRLGPEVCLVAVRCRIIMQ